MYRRELFIDVATLKNNQNTYYARFSFTPKADEAFPKTGVLFFTVILYPKIKLAQHNI